MRAAKLLVFVGDKSAHLETRRSGDLVTPLCCKWLQHPIHGSRFSFRLVGCVCCFLSRVEIIRKPIEDSRMGNVNAGVLYLSKSSPSFGGKRDDKGLLQI